MKRNFQNLANYNQWANNELCRHLTEMDSDVLYKDYGTFFSSVFLTFHHILNCDLIWLNRFSKLPCDYELASDLDIYIIPNSVLAINYANLDELLSVRRNLDKTIIQWIEGLREDIIQTDIKYNNISGKRINASSCGLITHFFNHQTHHRGQITTMLSQSGDNTYNLDYLEFSKR